MNEKNQLSPAATLRSAALLGVLWFNFLICLSLSQVTPYHNMKLRGVVHKTILRGNVIYERDRVCDYPAGQLLLDTAQGNATSKI